MSEHEIAALAEGQHGLLSLRQLRALAVSDETVRRRVEQGRWVRVHDGVYRVGGVPASLPQRALAACLAIGPEAAASHRTAAVLHDLLSYRDPPVDVTTTRARSPELAGVIPHRIADLADRWVSGVDGVPCTTVARTLVDLGAVARPATVQAALDRARGRRVVEVRDVRHAMRAVARKGRAGAGVIRALLVHQQLDAPAGVLEARMASLIRSAGLPSPAPEHVVRDAHGGFVAIVDFAYPDLRLVIEVDGFEAHSSVDAFRRDRARDRLLADVGWFVLHFTWPEVDRRQPHVAGTIARHYHRRRAA